MGTWTPGPGPTAGDDTFTGGAEFDVIDAGPGNDTVQGGPGDDFILGNTGNDLLSGGDGNDDIRGDAGDDVINGDAGRDFLLGGLGSNTIHGGVGDDSISAGDDYQYAQAGLNQLFGDAGDDTINVRALGPIGAKLFGGDGNDILGIMTPNGDTIDGGAGHDTIWVEGVLGTPSGEPVPINLVIDLVAQTVTGRSRTVTYVSMESVIGGYGNDIIRGDAGANWLIGADGDDILEGGPGDDIISGDTAVGRPGTDLQPAFLIDHYKSDTVTYEQAAGSVRVSLSHFIESQGQATGAAGTDRLYLIDNVIGSNFDDIIIGADFSGIRNAFGVIEYGRNRLEGRAGDDHISGLGGSDELLGQDGNDTLLGGSGNDWLSGGAGNDSLQGGDGDDVLLAGEGGVNSLDGGNGFDVVSFVELGAVEYDLTVGGAIGAGADTLISIEGMLGGELRNRFWGNAADNLLVGGGGDDDLFGRAGADRLVGGDGDDLIDGGEGDDVLQIGSGADTAVGGPGKDLISFAGVTMAVSFTLAATSWTQGSASATFSSIEGVIGSSQDDVLTGGINNDTLLGGAGADCLSGGDGDDWLDGQDYNASLFGGNGNDHLVARFDTIADGGAGDDVIEYYEGSTTLIGGEGVDELIFVFSANAYDKSIVGFEVIGVANTTLRQAQVDPLTRIYVATVFEGTTADLTFADALNVDLAPKLNGQGIRIGGSNFADIIWLGDGDDVIRGGVADVDDELHGRGGNDTFIADFGDDLFDGGSGQDTADYSELNIAVSASLLLGYSLDAEGNKDTYISVENLTGSRFSDTLVGDAAANILYGDGAFDEGLGGDTLTGMGGNDHLFGQQGSDILDGGLGDDALDGGIGDDVLVGGSGGVNVMNGGAGIDLLGLGWQTSAVFVDLAAGAYAYAGGGWDALTSIEGAIGGAANDTLLGDAGANLLRGGAGIDTLLGRDGADTLLGEAGDDWLDGGLGDDLLEGGVGVNVLIGGTGTDLASYASQTANLWIDMPAGVYSAAGVWDVFFQSIEGVLGGSGNDTIFGNALDNTLRGGGGDDALIGGLGNDRLEGGAGADWIVGGVGNDRLIGGEGVDVLTGGAGADTFDLGTAAGWDVAFDFNTAEDRFSLGGLSWLGFLTIDADGDGRADDTLLGYAGGNFVALNASGLSLTQWNALVDAPASTASGMEMMADAESAPLSAWADPMSGVGPGFLPEVDPGLSVLSCVQPHELSGWGMTG